MAVPFYLDGQSQTAGLFQQPQSSPNGYVPGQGTAPYAQPQYSAQVIPGTNIPASQAGTGGFVQAQGGIPAQYAAIMASTNPEHKAFQDQLRAQYGTSGQQTDGWLNSDELRARTDSLGNFVAPGSNGSGGSGSGSGGVPVDKGGLLGGNSNLGSPAPANNSPQFTGGGVSYPNNPAIPYNAPGDIPGSGGTSSGSLSMQQSSPQDALAAYKNTAGYQLLNTPGAYQASPGYQYAMDEAMRGVQGNASARGLLESGSALRGLNTAIQGVAQQDYGNWWQRQNQGFDSYQNRLAGLAGGNVGGDQAYNLGQAQGAGSLQTGSNLASLFGNQGAAGYGGLVNTGAAQSNNMTNAGAQQAQIGAANQSTQLAGAVYNRGLF